MLEVSAPNNRAVFVTASPTDASGRPAVVDGGLSAESDNGEGSTFAGPNPLSLYLLATQDSFTGDITYLIRADADLGEGIKEVSDTVLVHWTPAEAGEAASLGLTAAVVARPEV